MSILEKSTVSVVMLLALAATQASAAITNFSFINGLLGENEVGPVTSGGSGIINTLQYDDSVGAFGTLTIDVDYTGLTGNATAAHIHGAAGVGTNAGVLAALSNTGGTAGKITGTWVLSNASDVSSLFGDLTYLNLHSTFAPGGELRGQLTPVPEPATAAILSGLLAMACVMHRRAPRRS